MLFRECVGGENTQAMTAEFQSMSSRRESKSSVRGALILLSGSFLLQFEWYHGYYSASLFGADFFIV